MTTLASVLAAGALALGGAAPYGPAPDSLTWNAPPSGIVALHPGQVTTLRRGVTDIDVWRGNYRLRQRVDQQAGGYCFTLAHSHRCLAGYVRVNRDVFSFAHRTLRIYTWKG